MRRTRSWALCIVPELCATWFCLLAAPFQFRFEFGDPRGLLRQITAVAADRGRADLLARITSPTLVLHGNADPLVPVACGLDTSRRIPGARFALVPGMGHDLTPELVEMLLVHIAPFLRDLETQGSHA